ncbi:MAG: 1-acyl-sn-glycerol-3-phosphate acyltransferase [Clostridia bacterium]|nr:1-acyl-sn-glycerol-3-phosphate acyltransferase [Clostridia bacterium]
MSKFYENIYKALAKPVRWFYRATIIDGDKMPMTGGCLVCSNHTGLHDVIVLAACMKRQPRYMAKKELFKIPLLKQLITALGAFPVERKGADVSAIKTAISMIKSGEAVTVFPQGTRYRGVDPRETKPKNGVGMIAYRTMVPVVPVYIRTKKNHTLPFRRTEIICGDPIMPEELGFDRGGNEEYSHAAEYIFGKICDLADTHREDA